MTGPASHPAPHPADRSAEGAARVLAASMESLEGERCVLALATYRLLAEGAPVPVQSLATATGLDASRVERWIDDISAVYRDDAGRIVAFWGLAIPEMPHHFEVGGAGLHTWCAWDTLFLPALIGQTARVRSNCPTSGAEIALSVTPEKVEALHPPETRVSMLIPESGFEADVLQRFCHHVHFFASPAAGERWLAERDDDDAFLMTVDEAFRLGELWNAHRFGVGGTES